MVRERFDAMVLTRAGLGWGETLWLRRKMRQQQEKKGKCENLSHCKILFLIFRNVN